jgi:hypothetical protein
MLTLELLAPSNRKFPSYFGAAGFAKLLTDSRALNQDV